MSRKSNLAQAQPPAEVMTAMAPVPGGNLAGRLTAPQSSSTGIKTIGRDLRLFTMWREIQRTFQGTVVGAYYAVVELPVSRRHNNREGVYEDRVTNRLVHVPIHWARKGWKLHACAEDLVPWCSDQGVYPNGFEKLPKDWRETNATIDLKVREAMALSPRYKKPSQQGIEDLTAIIRAACGGRLPEVPQDSPFTGGSAEALAAAAAGLPDDERAKLAALIAGGADATP